MKNWMSKLLGPALVLAMLTSVAFGAVAEAIPADGVYEGSANGLGGELKVAVTVAGGKITEVKVGDHKETPGVGTEAMSPAALRRYVGRSGTIRHSGSNSVDAVSGATATSHAITAGVNRALAIVAGLDMEGGDVNYVHGEV